MDLRLEDIRTGAIRKHEFKDNLRNQLPRETYFYSNSYQIAYSALRLIKDIRVGKSYKSIDEKSREVLEVFFKTMDKPNEECTSLFVVNILDLSGDLPIGFKQSLERVAKRDLLNLDSLLDHYHSLDIVKSFRDKNASPRNHEQRTVLEFYNRTLKKRAEIVDYILFKLDDRALEKARNSDKSFIDRMGKNGKMDWMLKEYLISKDFPYREMVVDFSKRGYSYKLNFERLDYRKINLVINKSLFFPIKCDQSKGYSKQFFKEINKIKEEQTFKTLLFNVKEAPVIKARLRIFKELRRLYKQKLWYGFYSLALPQIEGIFAEMVKASSPSGKLTGALTDKVQQIRPFYESSEYSFDYYEFYLPNDRNIFSHTGKVVDVKRKCKILLLDLFAIVKVFNELDSPVIRVKNILDKGVESITDIGRLSNLLHLVEQTLEQELYEEVKIGCEAFIDDLSIKIDFVAFIRNLEIDFEREFKKYAENINLFSSVDGEQIELTSLSSAKFKGTLKRIQDVHDQHSFMFEEHLKLLVDTYYVISKFIRFFPSVKSDISTIIKGFLSKHRKEMKIIEILNAKLQFEKLDDFILLRKDLVHDLAVKRA